MRIRPVALLLLATVWLAACEKKNLPKIPSIGLMVAGPDSLRVNEAYLIQFSLVDGDADIGNSPKSLIHFKDSRYDTGYRKAEFPEIDGEVEDPNKGLEGECVFIPFPGPEPRPDSLHMATGDTLTYELYITDRAGNESNHITTGRIIVRP